LAAIVTIPGSKTSERLEENARAVDVAKTLTDEGMWAAAGTRYAEAGMKTLNRQTCCLIS
jgi:diketogulonate reductase-like aldo/keto reductase